MIYLKLYYLYFKIGMFSFGGGYASLPLIKEEIVGKHAMITMSELADILTLSEMTPGPIAINCATFVGTQTGGLLGAICATLGFITPSLIVTLTLAYFFFKYKNLTIVNNVLSYLKPVVIGVISSVALTLFYTNIMHSQMSLDVKSTIIFGICLLLLTKFKLKIYAVMPIAGALGLIFFA